MRYRITLNILSTLPVLLLAGLLGACASLPGVEEVTREPSHALSDPGGTRLHDSLKPLLASHPDKSGFHTLPIGEEAFIARLRLIQAAQKTLDCQYYIWHEDLTGAAMHDQLLAAADRGVRVRILQDDLNTAGMDETLRLLDAHDNIEVRLFNPFANREHRADDMVTDTRQSRYADALREFDLVRENSIADMDFAWSDWVLAYDHPSKIETKEVSAGTETAAGHGEHPRRPAVGHYPPGGGGTPRQGAGHRLVAARDHRGDVRDCTREAAVIDQG